MPPDARHLFAPATGRPSGAGDKLLLFIPCYNCGPQIGRVLARVGEVHAGLVDEVLVLDNRSGDDTRERAIAAAAELSGLAITVAQNRANHHLGGSHKAAFAYAARHGFSHVVVLHGDDQGDLADVVDFLRSGEHRRHDACLGARFAPGARLEGYSIVRTLGNRAMNLLFSAVTGRGVRDLGSGLNVFARSIFADPAVTRASDDLRFNIFLLLQAIDARRDLLFFPISWRETDQVSNVRLVPQALRTLAIAWTYAARRRHFRTADHRDHAVAGYAFDVLYAREAARG